MVSSRCLAVWCGYGGAVVIGRNVGATPMPQVAWRLFINDVVALVEARGGVVHTVASGVGEWDGVMEDSGVVVYGGPPVQLLHDELALLASRYGQACIATVGGANWLIRRADEEASRESQSASRFHKAG